MQKNIAAATWRLRGWQGSPLVDSTAGNTVKNKKNRACSTRCECGWYTCRVCQINASKAALLWSQSDIVLRANKKICTTCSLSTDFRCSVLDNPNSQLFRYCSNLFDKAIQDLLVLCFASAKALNPVWLSRVLVSSMQVMEQKAACRSESGV